MTRVVVSFEVALPPGVTNEDFAEYVRAGVESWSGQFRPDDPLFGWFRDNPLRNLKVRKKPKVLKLRKGDAK